MPDGMDKVSVVITKLNRPRNLEKALRSILAQTILPDEVIVVDQSDNAETENLIKKYRLGLTEKVNLRYLFEREKASARARNVGWRAATGQIVIIFDDDMILDRRFVSEILRVYREHPYAIGVQGTYSGWPVWKYQGRFPPFMLTLLNSVRKAFLVTHWEKDSQRILSSGGIVAPYPLTKTIEAEVIYTGLVSFRKVMDGALSWDENLKGYSWGEEFFTIRLNRRHPHSLYVTPFAKATHDYKSPGRPPEKKLCHVMTQYELYNFYRNVIPSDRSSLTNWVAFFWRILGQTILPTVALRRKEYRIRLFYIVRSYLWTFSHFNEVAIGKFDIR